MSIQQNRSSSIRPLTLFTGLSMAVIALACPAHGQTTKGPANPLATPPEMAKPYSYVFLDPWEGQHATAQDSQQGGGNHVGIEVHGHWVIDVKNPDGTVADHRDFENTVQGYGTEFLVGLMSGYAVPSDYGVVVEPNSGGTAPCPSVNTNQECGLVRNLTTYPGSFVCQNITCYTGLTYSTNAVDSGSTGSSFTLAGNFTATQAGTISALFVMYGLCPNTLAGVTTQTTISPATCSTTPGPTTIYPYRVLSSASITTVNVVASQIVQVTVTYTFS